MEKTGYPSIDKTHIEKESFLEKHPIIPNMSVYNSLGMISSFYRDAYAIDCEDLRATYQDLLHVSNVLSKGFKELGIKPKDIVTVVMPNLFQAVACFLAANRIGAITTFLSPHASDEEIKHYLNEFESPVLVNYNKTREQNLQLKEGTHARNVITLKRELVNEISFNEEKKVIGYDDIISFEDMKLVADYYKNYMKTNFNGKQDSLILFTSGSTTGNPKSVVLTNQNILASGIYMKNTAKVKPIVGEKCLICVPNRYPYGFSTSTLMSLMCGREAILIPTLSKDNINDFLMKNPNIIFGTPAFLELIKRNVPEETDLSSIHSFISGGDFLTPSQAQRGKEFFKKHGAETEMYNGSGNAETSGASTIAIGSKVKPETVGRILAGTEAIVINPDTMEELKYNEEGMLCISGKHVFKEYYNNEEQTKEAKFMFKGKEYLKTGSIGKLDEEGYFNLTGRSSRFYIPAIHNKVYTEYVQGVLSGIDIIDSCAVVPKPDDDELYTAKAYIVLKDGVKETPEAVEYIKDLANKPITNKHTNETFQLKSYEIPTSYTFLSEIPMTDADKINYTLLEKMAKEEYEIEKEKSKAK